jgi:hypothetical protein
VTAGSADKWSTIGTGRFVVVSGLRGSGKTMLARAIGLLLKLPVFDKDDILDGLFDARGSGDALWPTQLSREADVILQSTASLSSGGVISSFWHLPGMPSDSGTSVGDPVVVDTSTETEPTAAVRRVEAAFTRLAADDGR